MRKVPVFSILLFLYIIPPQYCVGHHTTKQETAKSCIEATNALEKYLATETCRTSGWAKFLLDLFDEQVLPEKLQQQNMNHLYIIMTWTTGYRFKLEVYTDSGPIVTIQSDGEFIDFGDNELWPIAFRRELNLSNNALIEKFDNNMFIIYNIILVHIFPLSMGDPVTVTELRRNYDISFQEQSFESLGSHSQTNNLLCSIFGHYLSSSDLAFRLDTSPSGKISQIIVNGHFKSILSDPFEDISGKSYFKTCEFYEKSKQKRVLKSTILGVKFPSKQTSKEIDTTKSHTHAFETIREIEDLEKSRIVFSNGRRIMVFPWCDAYGFSLRQCFDYHVLKFWSSVISIPLESIAATDEDIAKRIDSDYGILWTAYFLTLSLAALFLLMTLLFFRIVYRTIRKRR